MLELSETEGLFQYFCTKYSYFLPYITGMLAISGYTPPI